MENLTVGRYLSKRLVECGVRKFFTVPGDFTLPLLDQMISEPELDMVGCCNELNAGYSADGYCRETGGVGCIVATYMVGSISALNAVAGAYSQYLPLLVIVGGPNSKDAGCGRIIHHTIGLPNMTQSSQCYEPVVEKVFVVRHLQEAQKFIDEAVRLCATKKKPVYLEISCDLISQKIKFPVYLSSDYFLPKFLSDSRSLKCAIEIIIKMIQSAPKVVLIAGSKLEPAESQEAFLLLAQALGCGVAVMPDAKGLFPEHHELYMGCYWGGVSTRHVQGQVDSADLVIIAGGVLNDYTTVGWSSLLNPQKTVSLDIDYSDVCGQHFHSVHLMDLLSGLYCLVPKKPDSLHSFRRYVPETTESASDVTTAKGQHPEAPLNLRFLLHQLQNVVDRNVSAVVVETGDAWFMGQKLRLPVGVRYHVQMQYGSCGWALGASLGVGVAQKLLYESEEEDTGESLTQKRILALIGDGSFQFTAQELSTLIRQNVNVTIILLNNASYTIEVQIHDGPYNKIANWKYAELVNVLRDGNLHAVGVRVTTNAELLSALERESTHTGVMLIECCLAKDDCTSSLLEWGSRVAEANMR
mmetsp:Transcript_24963/g.50100  ORF Transcript_24963/g.50100 Transcript_24963/m.50100 type:complete len:583 (+) Transcript_24963:80-1828(+)